MKKIIYSILFMLLFAGAVPNPNIISVSLAQSAAVQPKTVQTAQQAVEVKPLDVVNTPQKYLNKTIIMKATFDKFSTLGLDYKPAMRSSQDYIGILIKRDEIVGNTIPLSEMKLFMKRNLAEKNINLDSDDKILITGKVFSTALGDPWIDITDLKVLQKAPKTQK